MDIDILHIAKLSRLKIDDSEIESFEKDMKNIIDMVEKMPEINEHLVLDADHPMKLREDKAVSGKFSRQELMSNAPQVKAGCVVVPKTVD